MRALSEQFRPYGWALSTDEIARRAGIAPERVLRFDGNTPPHPRPSATAETLTLELSRINTYRHGGFPQLVQAIADYAGVRPENLVLGAGADDLIMLVARSYAGPGDVVAIADEPTYPLFRVAAWVAGADVGTENPVLTFVCRPHNPTGALVPLPPARPLVVDEAYFEYSGGETAVGLIEDGVIVIRTFSKAFGLAGARLGYAIASADTAAALNERQSPAPYSSLTAALALAGLADRPDVSATLAERDRLAAGLRDLGFEPTPSWANFVYVPLPDAPAVAEGLLSQGLAIRGSAEGIRITPREPEDDDVLLRALASLPGVA
jgi:histidinol-phosphate aminotransferase